VLLSKAQLSPEQAYAIQKGLRHSPEEVAYFLLLVEWDRAGDPELKAYCLSRIESAQEARTDLQKRFKDAGSLTREDQAKYYSSYHYAAIHACISVPELQSAQALERFLKLPPERVTEVLSFLAQAELATEEKGRWSVGHNRLHLGRNSDLIRQHHSNWRIEALKSLDRGRGAQGLEDLHYSAAVSVSHEDAARIKELWIKTLEEFGRVVAPSKEETVRALVLDFFALG
jgi:hypothetical protein